MIPALKSLISTDFLRRTVTVPVKVLVIASIAVTIIVFGSLLAARVQRHYGDAPATAADVASLRASIADLRTVCTPAKPKK